MSTPNSAVLITPVHILHPVAQDDFAGAVKEHQPYFAKRVELFNQYKARQAAALEAAKAANAPIRIVLPDGGGAPCCCPASRCFPIDGSHLRTAVSHAFAARGLHANAVAGVLNSVLQAQLNRLLGGWWSLP